MDWRLAGLRHRNAVLGLVGGASFASSGGEGLGANIAEAGGYCGEEEPRGLGQRIGHVCGVCLRVAEQYGDLVSAAGTHKGVDCGRVICWGQCILCCERAVPVYWAYGSFGGDGVWSGMVLYPRKEAAEETGEVLRARTSLVTVMIEQGRGYGRISVCHQSCSAFRLSTPYMIQ